MELEILASKLQLDIGYEIPSQKEQHMPKKHYMSPEEQCTSPAAEEQILAIQVSGLPVGMDNLLKMSIEHYLMKLNIKFKSCEMIGNIAYVTLEDPSSE